MQNSNSIIFGSKGKKIAAFLLLISSSFNFSLDWFPLEFSLVSTLLSAQLYSFVCKAMDDDVSKLNRRMSSRTRKVASKMAAALASTDNRTQAALARLEALENDYVGMEMVETNDDDEASHDDDDDEVPSQVIYKKSSQRAQKGKLGKQKHSRMLGKLQETFLSSYMSWSSELFLPPTFLHCLWICFQLYMR
ncbi:SWR1 complex subunit 6 isoform X4 [Mercurialis annua]|uniref:SWR1 complex subunit 6 isoform X4 n=1 Tax=Mercurialis annua TaxID=3986 RepID=UPI00215F0C14|nr:SWR1 complex subunit 6 isoform X4 [Mercurialis annua]